MFERYTEKARRTIFFSRYEASQFGSPYIETEHLLLGLLRESRALAYRFLRSSESVYSIRKQIEAHTTLRDKVSTSVDLPFSNECKRVLAYAAEEADRLSHKHIGTEHLLLGLLREDESFAAQLLQERGVSLESARAAIGSGPSEELGPALKSQGIYAGYTSRKLIYNAASEMLIVEMRGIQHLHPLPTRLFMRHKDSEVYERIGDPPDGVSYEFPVTCEKLPLVVFNSTERDAEGRGHWGGVYAFNPSTKELAVCIPKDSLTVSEPHVRLWITDLVSLSDDGQKLYLNLGIEKETPGREAFRHYLAAVELADRKLELLSPLKDVRF